METIVNEPYQPPPPYNPPPTPAPYAPTPYIPPPGPGRPAGPPPGPPSWQAQSQRQPPAAPRQEQPEQVVQVWVGKGWFGPVVLATLTLGLIGFLIWLGIHEHNERQLAGYQAVLAVPAVLAVAAALRRKATLTTRHLILRQLLGTRTIPLPEIVSVTEHHRRSRGDNVDSLAAIVVILVALLFSFLWYLVAPIPVRIRTKKGYTTLAFGWGARKAMVVIVEAAKAAGSPIETAP